KLVGLAAAVDIPRLARLAGKGIRVRQLDTEEDNHAWVAKAFCAGVDHHSCLQRCGCCRSTTRRWRWPIYGSAGCCGPYCISGELCDLPFTESCGAGRCAAVGRVDFHRRLGPPLDTRSGVLPSIDDASRAAG